MWPACLLAPHLSHLPLTSTLSVRRWLAGCYYMLVTILSVGCALSFRKQASTLMTAVHLAQGRAVRVVYSWPFTLSNA